jgi:diguanylate cyclase
MKGPTTTAGSGKGGDTDPQNPMSQPAQIADGLLELIHDYAKEEKSPETDEFCSHISGYRWQLSGSDPIGESTTKECIEKCAEHFHRINLLSNRRAAEFGELIELLKDALTHGLTDSEAFNEQIFTNSDQFKRLTTLDDVLEIKKELAQLVRGLRQIVLDKQQADEKKRQGLAKRVEILESRLEAARREALMDPLTRVANRGAFDQNLRSWVAFAKPFVVGIIDLDRFKSINDSHGHRVGDSVLVCAAQWIGQSIRSKDLLARYGGDEFAVLLDGISLTAAQHRFEALLKELSDRSYVYTLNNAKRTVTFTMSCGLTEFSSGDTAATVVQRADEALYDAKKRRNQVCAKRVTLFGGLFK